MSISSALARPTSVSSVGLVLFPLMMSRTRYGFLPPVAAIESEREFHFASGAVASSRSLRRNAMLKAGVWVIGCG